MKYAPNLVGRFSDFAADFHRRIAQVWDEESHVENPILCLYDVIYVYDTSLVERYNSLVSEVSSVIREKKRNNSFVPRTTHSYI